MCAGGQEGRGQTQDRPEGQAMKALAHPCLSVWYPFCPLLSITAPKPDSQQER